LRTKIHPEKKPQSKKTGHIQKFAVLAAGNPGGVCLRLAHASGKSQRAVYMQNTNCQGSFKKYLVQLLFESTSAPSTRCEPGAAPFHLLHWSASGKIRLGWKFCHSAHQPELVYLP
jgi:hypothetical protein